MSEQKNQPPLNIKIPASVSASTQTDISIESQSEIDRQASLLRFKTEELRLKREILELKKLEDDVRKIDNKNALIQMSHDGVESALKDLRDGMERHHNACNHMKGGASENLVGGNPSFGTDGSNYAFIDHTFSHGVRFRLCMRCGKTWFPKDPDYRWAMSRPTKNTPSSAYSNIVRNAHKPESEGGPRMTSEIPHRVFPSTDVPS